MTDPLEVTAHEHGLTRVFVAETDPDGASAPLTNEEAAGLLGAHVDPAKVEVVPAGSLAGMGLSGYLVDGYGVAANEVAPDRQRLDDLGGQIVLVPSSATGGPARFDPQPPLRFVGRYGEPPVAPHEVMTPTPAEERPAEPAPVHPSEPSVAPAPERRMPVGLIVAGAVVLAVLLVLMF